MPLPLPQIAVAPADTDKYTIVGWKAYYADGSSYDSRTTAWAALPPVGLVILMFYYSANWDKNNSKPYRYVQMNCATYNYGGIPITGTVLSLLALQPIFDAAFAAEAW